MDGQFTVGCLRGLSTQEATERLKQEGYNDLPSPARRGGLTIALEVMREPMFLLLLASGAIYAIFGNFGDASMLLVFVFIVMGITIFQERKTERALEALRDLSSPRALVLRDSEPKRIACREVVRGDILVLVEGDRVPADGVLLTCNDLSVDESLLTGEAVPVRKSAWDGKKKMQRPGGDDLPFVYSGTMLVQGRGIARVEATGVNTEIGKIGKVLQSNPLGEIPLQKQSKKLVLKLATVGVTFCFLVAIIYGLTRESWLNGLLVGIALAMALLPEEIPVVLTIFLALGARRISEKRVLTRRIPALDALGSATVLCVDKTGTLTLNRMTVSKIVAQGGHFDAAHHTAEPLPDPFRQVLQVGILASESDPFDPMERALKQLGDRSLADARCLYSGWSLVHEYSLSPELLALSHVWKSPETEEFLVASKGAPEAIASLCHFDKAQSENLLNQVSGMAQEGLRVIAVAKANFKGMPWPGSQHDFDFEFLGLIGFADPVRPTVPDAIRQCERAGIRVLSSRETTQ